MLAQVEQAKRLCLELRTIAVERLGQGHKSVWKRAALQLLGLRATPKLEVQPSLGQELVGRLIQWTILARWNWDHPLIMQVLVATVLRTCS